MELFVWSRGRIRKYHQLLLFVFLRYQRRGLHSQRNLCEKLPFNTRKERAEMPQDLHWCSRHRKNPWVTMIAAAHWIHQLRKGRVSKLCRTEDLLVLQPRKMSWSGNPLPACSFLVSPPAHECFHKNEGEKMFLSEISLVYQGCMVKCKDVLARFLPLSHFSDAK